MANLDHLLSNQYRDSKLVLPDPKDQASLITKVYSNLGILSPAAAERAPEELTTEIEELYERNPARPLEPFLAINLGQVAHLRLLVEDFNQVYSGKRPSLFCSWKFWNQYDLKNINRRCPNGGKVENSIRGHHLVVANNQHEPGLFVDESYRGPQIFESVREKRRTDTLLNVVDWICIEAMRRESGLDSLDTDSATMFPQLDSKLSETGYRSVVGTATSRFNSVNLVGAEDSYSSNIGVRRSLGSKK